MAATKPIPIRLGADTIKRLDKAAARIGNNRAGIVRFLVESWLEEFERTGKAELPVQWKKIIAATDGRTSESKLSTRGNLIGRDQVDAVIAQSKVDADRINSRIVSADRIRNEAREARAKELSLLGRDLPKQPKE